MDLSKSNDPRYNFYANPTMEELAAQQGVGPVKDPRTLIGDFWPEDEPVEDFIAAWHEWRGHNKPDRAA